MAVIFCELFNSEILKRCMLPAGAGTALLLKVSLPAAAVPSSIHSPQTRSACTKQ
jgi:hypothetical protein